MAAPKRNRANYNAYMREYMGRRYERRRERAIREMGGACVQCGSDDRLEFDHRKRSTKAFDIAKRLASAPWREIAAELKKCQLLCRTCHMLKTVDRDMEHWTLKNERLIAHKARLENEQVDLFGEAA